MKETNFKRVQKELKKYDSDIAREALNILFVLAASPGSEEEAQEFCNTYLPSKVNALEADKRRNIRVLDPFYEEFMGFIDQMMKNLDDIMSNDDALDGMSEIIEEMITLLKDYNTLSKKEFLELLLNTAIGAMSALRNKFGDLINEISNDSPEMGQLFDFTDYLKEELEDYKDNLPKDKITEKEYHTIIEKACTFIVNAIVMANVLTVMSKDGFELEEDYDEEDEDEDEFDIEDEDEFDFGFKHNEEPIFDSDDKRAFELKIKLMHTNPEVYRTVMVPAGYNLDYLHHIIQDVFDWDDMHLHEFIKNKQRYNPRPDTFHGDIDSTQVLLSEVFKRKGSRIKYVYDFGDSWLLEISVLKTHKNIEKTYPVCIDAYGTSPEEDSGGIIRYLDMIDEGEVEENEYDLKKINRILKKAYKGAFE